MDSEDFRELQASHQALKTQVEKVSEEVKGVSGRVDGLASGLKANTEATERTESNTKEIVAAFNNLKGGFTVLEWLGKAAGKLFWLGLPGAFFLWGWAWLKTWLMTGGPK